MRAGPLFGFNVSVMITMGGRATTSRWACAVALGCLMSATAACGAGDDGGPTTFGEVTDTVAIGRMPEPLSDREPPPVPPTTPAPSTPPTTRADRGPIDGPIGDAVDGNRLLMIGDSVLAATAPRSGGIACDVLTGFGWAVEIAAEPGRFVEFGDTVLDERLAPDSGDDWDVAVIMLGNFFDGDVDAYGATLDAMLERLAPRPVLLFTLSEVDDDHAVLNDVIRSIAAARSHVVVIDWAALTAAEPEKLLDGGGPGLTDEGAGRLVLFTAAALGEAPDAGAGECLPPVFTDDSAIVL